MTTHSKNELRQARVALFEARMADELSSLVRRRGGVPTCVPAVREVPRDASSDVSRLIDELRAGSVDLVVFQTGASVDELARIAGRLGRKPDLIGGLRSVITISRGPKPVAALRRLGLAASLVAPSPHTTAELLPTLAECRLDGAHVAVVHHGELNAPLTGFLGFTCGRVSELVVYEWELPADTSPLQEMVRDLVTGVYDVAAFTSQVQVRNLFTVAEALGLAGQMALSLNTKLATAAVGPTCAAELRRRGVARCVVPDHPKMGHMVLELASHFARRSAGSQQAQAAGQLAPDPWRLQ